MDEMRTTARALLTREASLPSPRESMLSRDHAAAARGTLLTAEESPHAQ